MRATNGACGRDDGVTKRRGPCHESRDDEAPQTWEHDVLRVTDDRVDLDESEENHCSSTWYHIFCTSLQPYSHPSRSHPSKQTDVDRTSTPPGLSEQSRAQGRCPDHLDFRSDDAGYAESCPSGSAVSLLERQLPSLSRLSLPQRALLLAPSHAPEPALHVHSIR